MSVMRLPRGTPSRVIDYQIRGSHFAYNRQLGGYSDLPYGLGQSGLQTGLSVASTAATFIPVVGPVLGPVIGMFGKLFGGGKSKAQKKAESMQRRTARAAGAFQAVANALTAYPNSVENLIMGKVQQLLTTGAGGDFAVNAPCEVVQAFVNAPYSGKKRAVAAMRSYQQGAQTYISQGLCKSGQAWWDEYLAGKYVNTFGPIDPGYQRLMAQAYSGPVHNINGRWTMNGNKATITQSGQSFIIAVDGNGSFTGKFTAQDKIVVDGGDVEAVGTVGLGTITWEGGGPVWKHEVVPAATPVAVATPVAQGTPDRPTTVITPSGGAPIVAATPTSDGQAQIAPVQPIQAGFGGALGLLLGGGLLLLALGGKKQQKRRRRPARGTTIIRRY